MYEAIGPVSLCILIFQGLCQFSESLSKTSSDLHHLILMLKDQSPRYPVSSFHTSLEAMKRHIVNYILSWGIALRLWDSLTL